MKKNLQRPASKPGRLTNDKPAPDDSGEYKGGTQTGSTVGRLHKNKSQAEKERVQEGGTDRK